MAGVETLGLMREVAGSTVKERHTSGAMLQPRGHAAQALSAAVSRSRAAPLSKDEIHGLAGPLSLGVSCFCSSNRIQFVLGYRTFDCV